LGSRATHSAHPRGSGGGRAHTLRLSSDSIVKQPAFAEGYGGQANAPPPVFFVEAPGRPVVPQSFPLRMRGDGAPGGAAVDRFNIRISLRRCGSASRRATRTVLGPGSFAGVFFRFAQCRKRNCCAGPRFTGAVLIETVSRSENPPRSLLFGIAGVSAGLSGKADRAGLDGRLRQPAPGRRLILATGRSPGAARVRGRSVRLPPAGAASGSIIRRLMMTPLDKPDPL
jgi:hypothetical protein